MWKVSSCSSHVTSELIYACYSMDKIRHSFIGHQGRCFDVRYSLHGDQMLSASEDGTAKLWDINTRKCLFTFDHGEMAYVNPTYTIEIRGSDLFTLQIKTTRLFAAPFLMLKIREFAPVAPTEMQ